MKKLLPIQILIFVLFIQLNGFSQSNYFMDISITEQSGNSQANYQVYLNINTELLVTQGKMNVDGSDIRFFADSCLTIPLNHYLEAGMNTDSTDIWVLVPAIAASSTIKIYMGYGDTGALSTSNFATVFPNAVISGGSSLTLTGVVNTNWLQIDAGDVLTVGSGAPLEFPAARKIIINGSINGDGAGYAGGAAGSGSGQPGSGPGGGTVSNPMNSGCGGGSYAGVGGTGGFDSGDTPGVGGAIYGTDTGFDFDMGSGGAASDLNFGGAGGGALQLVAEFVSITGNISMNGASAQQPGGGRGAGGGAGGAVLVFGKNVFLSGTIQANGGGGSIGTSTANDDGGSGAGGRIKLFHTQSLTNVGVTSVNGGIVGTNGTGGPPTAGGMGNVSTQNFSDGYLEVTLGNETSLEFSPLIISSGSNCDGQTIILSADENYSSYLWSTGETTQSIDVTISDDYSLIIPAPFGCGVTGGDTLTITFNPLPNVDLGSDTTICLGNTLVLDAGAGFTNYQWTTGELAQTISLNASTLGIGTFPFAVTVTDNNGCQNISAISVEVEDCSIGISEINLSQKFKVYPNPTTSEIWIELEEQVGLKSTITLIDVAGKEVYYSEFSSQEVIKKIDLSKLHAGTYFVKFSNANGTGTRMIVKH